MTYRAGCATTTATRTESLLAAGALLFLASAAATVHWSRSMAGGMAMPGGWTLAMVWMAMPGETWAGSAGRFVAMWRVMMVAMMLPLLLPILAHFPRNGLAAPAGVAYISVLARFCAAVYRRGSGLARARP